MGWADLKYDDETTHPLGRTRRQDEVAPNPVLFAMHQKLIGLRKAHLRLFVDGGHRWLVTDDAAGVLAYARTLGNEEVVVAFNKSEQPRGFRLPEGRYREIFTSVPGAGPGLLAPQTARVWIRE
jgi:glycosidase